MMNVTMWELHKMYPMMVSILNRETKEHGARETYLSLRDRVRQNPESVTEDEWDACESLGVLLIALQRLPSKKRNRVEVYDMCAKLYRQIKSIVCHCPPEKSFRKPVIEWLDEEML